MGTLHNFKIPVHTQTFPMLGTLPNSHMKPRREILGGGPGCSETPVPELGGELARETGKAGKARRAYGLPAPTCQSQEAAPTWSSPPLHSHGGWGWPKGDFAFLQVPGQVLLCFRMLVVVGGV